MEHLADLDFKRHLDKATAATEAHLAGAVALAKKVGGRDDPDSELVHALIQALAMNHSAELVCAALGELKHSLSHNT